MNLGGSALVDVFRNAVDRTNGFGSFVHLKGVRVAYNPNATDPAEKIALIQVCVFVLVLVVVLCLCCVCVVCVCVCTYIYIYI